jgi:hypothetical protein
MRKSTLTLHDEKLIILTDRMGIVMDRYSTVPTADPASIGVKMK